VLRLVRDRCAEAERQGIDWRGVINCLREFTPASLAIAARSREAAISCATCGLTGRCIVTGLRLRLLNSSTLKRSNGPN